MLKTTMGSSRMDNPDTVNTGIEFPVNSLIVNEKF